MVKKADMNFAKLLRMVNDIEGLEKMDLLPIKDQLDVDTRDCDKVCNQIHLPVQVALSNILKK